MSLGARPTTLPERPTGQVFSEDILRTHHSHEKYPLLQHRSAAAPLVPIAPPRMRDRDYREHYNPYPHGRARSPNRPPSPRQYHDPPTSSSAPDYDPRRRLSYNSRVPQSDSWRPLREPPTNRVTSQPLRRDTREGNSSSTRSWNPDRSFQPSASWSRNRDDYSPPPRSPVVPRKPVDFHASGPSLSYMQHDDYPPVGDSEAESYSPPPRPPRPLVRKPPEFLFSGPSRSYIAHEHYPPPGRDSGSYPDRPDFRSADNVYSRRNPRPTNRPSALGSYKRKEREDSHFRDRPDTHPYKEIYTRHSRERSISSDSSEASAEPARARPRHRIPAHPLHPTGSVWDRSPPRAPYAHRRSPARYVRPSPEQSPRPPSSHKYQKSKSQRSRTPSVSSASDMSIADSVQSSRHSTPAEPSSLKATNGRRSSSVEVERDGAHSRAVKEEQAQRAASYDSIRSSSPEADTGDTQTVPGLDMQAYMPTEEAAEVMLPKTLELPGDATPKAMVAELDGAAEADQSSHTDVPRPDKVFEDEEPSPNVSRKPSSPQVSPVIPSNDAPDAPDAPLLEEDAIMGAPDGQESIEVPLESIPVGDEQPVPHLTSPPPVSQPMVTLQPSVERVPEQEVHQEHSLPIAPVVMPQHRQDQENGHSQTAKVSQTSRPSDSPAYVFSKPIQVTPQPSIAAALRVCIAARREDDRATRDDRVNKILAANRALVDSPRYDVDTTADELIYEVLNGKTLRKRLQLLSGERENFLSKFAAREYRLREKSESLREEYKQLHEKWVTHCKRLDDLAKLGVNEPVPPTPAEEAPAIGGRTTRRSAAAGHSDIIHTDLDMERVIAGLNNDNATDPNYLAADNLARIPDMISLTMGDNVVLYDDSNGLIEDPHQFFDFGARPEVWTEEEKDIFLHQYALYPKQFGAIAKALENKSPADCVLFYYLHKKGHIDFRDAVTRFAPGRRRRGARKSGKQKGNALISDIASSRPRRVAQKDSPAPSPFPDGEEPRPRRRGRPSNAEVAAAALAAKKQRQARRAANGEASPADSEVERPEGRRRTTLTARARASMEVDGVEVTATKRPYRKVARKQVATPPVSVVATAVPVNTTVAFATTGKTVAAPGPIANAVSHTFVGTPGAPAMARVSTPQEAEKSTSRAPKSVGSSSWTDQEQEQFLSLLRQHGPNFKRISASMPNKTAIQLQTWFRANDARLGLSAIAAAAEEHPPSPEFAKQSIMRTKGPDLNPKVSQAPASVANQQRHGVPHVWIAPQYTGFMGYPMPTGPPSGVQTYPGPHPPFPVSYIPPPPNGYSASHYSSPYPGNHYAP